MNSILKKQKHKCNSHTNLCFFVSMCILNLVLKILGIANMHLVNTHNFCSTFLESCNLNLSNGII
jgi:hypothetical protein